MVRNNQDDKLNRDLLKFSIDNEEEFPEVSKVISEDSYYERLLGYYLEYLSSEYEFIIKDRIRILDLVQELKRIGEVEKSEDLMEIWIENFQ